MEIKLARSVEVKPEIFKMRRLRKSDRVSPHLKTGFPSIAEFSARIRNVDAEVVGRGQVERRVARSEWSSMLIDLNGQNNNLMKFICSNEISVNLMI